MNAALDIIPHFYDYYDKAPLPEFKIVICSWDRSEMLCAQTLSLIKRNNIPLDRVGVFVPPGRYPKNKIPEWQMYLNAFRKYGFLDVNLFDGGTGIETNMTKAFEWVGNGYFVSLADNMSEIQQRSGFALGKKGKNDLTKLPDGGLRAIICHGYEMLRSGKYMAWSLNPNHNGVHLSNLTLSRKLGLLDSVCSGVILPKSWQPLRVSLGHGHIYDVEWTTRLWHHGGRFVRYMGLCTVVVAHKRHPPPEAIAHVGNYLQNRCQTNKALMFLAQVFPQELEIIEKNLNKPKTTQYAWKRDGLGPLTMKFPEGITKSSDKTLQVGQLSSARKRPAEKDELPIDKKSNSTFGHRNLNHQ